MHNAPNTIADLMTMAASPEIGLDPYETVDVAFAAANKLLQGYGVEAIHDPAAWHWYYADVVLLYVNVGDPYTPTLLYDTSARQFVWAGWGDWLESREEDKEI